MCGKPTFNVRTNNYVDFFTLQAVAQSLPIPVPAPPSHTHGRQHSLGDSSVASDANQSPNATPNVTPPMFERTATPLFERGSQPTDADHLHAHFNETVSMESTGSVQKPGTDLIGKEKLTELRTAILRSLFSRLEEVEKLGGEHCIPFFQVSTLC